jgi:CheY-like chemotaxis protein
METRRKRHLLLVEDDAVDVLAVRRALFRAGLDGALEVVGDGVEALEWLRSGGWAEAAVVVTDLELPRLGGLQLLRELRRDFTLRGLEVIILTHRDDPAARAEAERLGVRAYLLKPLQPAALLELLSGPGLAP